MFRRILVEIDPEADNQTFIAKVVQLARQFEAEVVLFGSLYCRSIEHGYLFDDVAKERAKQAFVKARQPQMDALTEQVSAQGVTVRNEVSWSGRRSEDLAAAAEQFDAELVVVAQNDPSIIERLFTETAVDIARVCKRPLMLVHPELWKSEVRLGVGFDPFHEDGQPSELDSKILEFSGHLATHFKTKIDVIHSIHTLPHAAIFDENIITDYETLKAQVSQDHKSKVQSMVEQSNLSEHGQLVFLSGECHIELPRYIQDRSINLMVIGHAEHGLADRVLQGDMLDKVITELDSDILVIK